MAFQDTIYALLHLKDFVAMQAVRPLSLSAALDAVLNHPDFRDHVDSANIVASVRAWVANRCC